MCPCLLLFITWKLWLWGHSNVCFLQGCVCMCWAPAITHGYAISARCQSFHALTGLCSRYSFCTSKRAAESRVCTYVWPSVWICLHTSSFAIVCLTLCSGAKCKMIARQRRKQIDVGAFWKPRESHTRAHKHTLPIFAALLCSRDGLNTYCIFVCAYVCFFCVSVWTTNTSLLGQTFQNSHVNYGARTQFSPLAQMSVCIQCNV